ncbi:glycosyltransferase family 2 protein [Enterobacter quasiroggenkampii]|uniref:glycosyltransferase family 2 protein n=1 Tax=Enterobacter quasiroggenkampii TaxID=2497436 RepID=UPI00064ECBD5|nr:glycosyltransferase family 2 protein [Enterobacter quasiroggenkampii]KML18772.1 family 2 glycosyl transferase [Leclercia adecarboxylata]KMN62079.1 family 2 glycosyl transferase [Leclercia sp. LK8]MCU6366778.1 glycosyltransferase [Enterobacter quasiroggenkampii]
MKVSIITATYNSVATISDTLLSLDAQTYDNIEYIIIDGASRDSTIELIHNTSRRVTKIISEPDKGIYDALNKGIQAATGDIIGFLHSDDLLAYPDVITDVVSKFKENQCDAVYGDLEYVSKDNVNNVVRRWNSGVFKRFKMQLGWMPPHPSFYMKRELYLKWGMFNLQYKISADYDSLVRYLWVNSASVSYLPKVLTKMRVGGMSNRSFSNIVQKSKEDIKVMRNNGLLWPIVLVCKNFSKLPQFLK